MTDWASYIPIGEAPRKVARWAAQGAEVLYLTSRRLPAEVAAIAAVLDRHRFPQGSLLSRGEGETYREPVERGVPDLLIEDDCESIGGIGETTYARLSGAARRRVRSLLVNEFEGIDALPDALERLLACAAVAGDSEPAAMSPDQGHGSFAR